MKKKTSFYLGTFLLLAVLTLGIGYAAITKNLSVEGGAKASANNENFKVKFDSTVNPTITKTNDSFDVTATITGDLTATIDVNGLTTKNDSVTVVYTIKNESPELGANLAVDAINNTNTEYFDVTATLTSNSIAKGTTTTVSVTVKLNKTPIDEQTTTITVPITATAVEA